MAGCRSGSGVARGTCAQVAAVAPAQGLGQQEAVSARRAPRWFWRRAPRCCCQSPVVLAGDQGGSCRTLLYFCQRANVYFANLAKCIWEKIKYILKTFLKKSYVPGIVSLSERSEPRGASACWPGPLRPAPTGEAGPRLQPGPERWAAAASCVCRLFATLSALCGRDTGQGQANLRLIRCLVFFPVPALSFVNSLEFAKCHECLLSC